MIVSLQLGEVILVLCLVYVAAAIPWVVVLWLMNNRPHYNSGAGRKLREQGENGIAKRVPGMKASEDKIKILEGILKNLEYIIDDEKNGLQAEHDLTQKVMDGLDLWIKK